MVTDARKPPAFFYGYVIVIAACIIAVVIEGLLFSFGIFFESLLNEFGWSRAMTSGAFSLYSLIRLPIVILAGRLTDRFGSRAALTACGLFLGAGYMLMSQVNSPWQLYLFYGGLVGTGMGLYWVPLMAVVPRWFVRRRSLMLGIVVTGISIGQLIIPPTTSWLISVYGWRTAYLIAGAACLVVATILAQFMRQNPADMGLSAYGESAAENEQTTNDNNETSVGEAIRSRQFWLFCLVWFPWIFCLGVILVHIVIHATGLGMSPTAAASIIAIIGIAGIGGRLGLGHLADVIGLKPVLVLCLSLTSVSFAWLLIAKETWMIFVFAAIYGVSYSTFEVIQSPIVVRLFGLRSFGAIFGIALAISSTGFTLGPITAGYIFDTTRSYQLAFIISLVMSLVSLAAAVLLPIAEEKRRGA